MKEVAVVPPDREEDKLREGETVQIPYLVITASMVPATY